MKTFSDIPDIGPGAEIYSLSTAGRVEILFRTTAGEYVLDKHPVDSPHKRDYAIIDESEAIDWCVQHGKCRSAADFFKKVWKIVCRMSRKERKEYKAARFLIPRQSFNLQRALELLQLPVFRQCLIRDCEGISQISTSEIDWLDLLTWVDSLMSEKSLEGGPIPVGPEETFERLPSKPSCLQYRATWKNFSINAECWYAVAPVEFPMEFDSFKLDQGVWVRVEEGGGGCDRAELLRIAASAIGLLISSILLYEIAVDEPVDRTQLPPEKQWIL
jgi:hypothetical protein